MLLALVLGCVSPQEAQAAASDLAFVDVGERAAPMSLTAADGTGLKLAEMHVEAVVESPLAFTEMRLVFENPENRRIEGRFEITLPTGAAISRFAMKLGDKWQEGEVVELQAARRAYEDFLHRRTDPALLEYDAGNEFRARVFPIEPNSRKEIIISWSHDLDEDEAWALPTGGLPELGVLNADVYVSGERYSMHTEYAVPEGDLSLLPKKAPRLALRSADTTVLRLEPKLSVAKDAVADATLLIDTSASRALSFEDVLADVASTVPSFTGNLTVYAYDQAVTEIYQGPARGFGAPQLDALRAHGAMGASDLEQALRAVGTVDRLLVYTDGVLTAGDLESGELVDLVKKAGIGRVDAVLRGGARDEALLNAFVAAGARDGVLLDADSLDAEDVTRRLGLGTAGEVKLEVPGAEWIWPQYVTGLQPGDSLTVYADLPRTAPASLLLDGRAVGRFNEKNSEGPLLKRASAQAEIGALLAEKGRADGAEARQAIIDEIVEVSTRNRVLSPHTALLVLETEADYERFNIPRNALTDILVVDEGELGWIERKGVVTGVGESVDAPTDAEKESDKDDAKPEAKRKRMANADGAPPPPAAPPAMEPVEEMELMEAAKSAEAQAQEERSPSASRAQARHTASRAAPARQRRRARRNYAPTQADADRMELDEDEEVEAPTKKSDPLAGWEGDYRSVKELILAGSLMKAETFAKEWRARSPGDPLALLALGEVWEAMERPSDAARAYGSLIDLFPSRADLRRLAGERLETLGKDGIELAIDTFAVAVEQRKDHPSGHRMLAWALLKNDQHEEALKVLQTAADQPFDRFEAAHTILSEDAALIAAGWRKTDKTGTAAKVLAEMNLTPATQPDLRFILNWETDANDVDFHIYDGKGGHAYYSNRNLPSGGTLYADITSGYGPECFSIPDPEAFPYTLQAHYYSRGPMGFGMGKLQVVQHDGKGNLSIDERPFVVMTDGAFVPLGTVDSSAF